MQAHVTAYRTGYPRLIMSVILSLTLALGLIISPGTPGAAQNKDLPKPEMETEMREAAFMQETEIIKAAPSGLKSLAFRMRLPKDWQEVGGSSVFEDGALELSSSLLSTIADYRGPGSLQGRSFFKLKARKLKKIITAKKWFRYYAINKGSNLEAIQETSPGRVEARYTVFRNDTSYTVMAIATINSNQLVLAEYYLPTSRMNSKAHDLQILCLRSFELTNKLEKPIEPIKTYQFVDIAKIDYPASWLIQTPLVRDLDEINLTLYNTEKDKLKKWDDFIQSDAFKGRIRIKLIVRRKVKSVSSEIKAIRERYQKRGLRVDKLIREVEDIDYDNDFDLARTQAYTVRDEDGAYLDFQLWVAVMRSSNYYVFVTLFTPDREHEYYNWAVNSEAFRRIISSVDIK